MPIQKFTVLTLPNLIKVLKRLGYVLAVLCGISAAFLVLLLLINLPVFDEDLHPDLAALRQNEALPPLANNAYYGLVGFRAAPGKDFIATGQALTQRYLDNRAAGTDRLSNEDYEELLGADALSSDSPLGRTCHSLLPTCSLEELGTMLREGDYDRAQMDLTLQRYDALLALSTLQYLGQTTVLSPTPSYGPVRDAQKDKLAERYNTGSSIAFLNQIAADLRFWKLVLRDGRWLLDKMIAVSALWTDMQALAEYMAAHELSAEDRALIDAFLVPLTAEELDVGESFVAEAQDLYRLLQYLHTYPQYPQGIIGNRLQLQLTLPNATTNMQYTNVFKPLIELGRLSAADFARTISTPEYKAMMSEEYELGLSPASLYNLGGKLSFGNVRLLSSYTYIGRMHDINAMMLAVRLQFELKGTAPEAWAASIENSSITQPYTGEPFAYDAQGGWLTFECRDPPGPMYAQTNNLRCRVKL